MHKKLNFIIKNGIFQNELQELPQSQLLPIKDTYFTQ